VPHLELLRIAFDDDRAIRCGLRRARLDAHCKHGRVICCHLVHRPERPLSVPLRAGSSLLRILHGNCAEASIVLERSERNTTMLRTLAAAFVAASMLTAPVMAAENAATKPSMTQAAQTPADAKVSAVKSAKAKSHHKSVKKVEARKHMKHVRHASHLRHASKVRHVMHATHKNTHVARQAPKSSVN
jgi:hypothetical protein